MKIYGCPECGMVFNSLSWDKSTIYELNLEGYHDNYGRIDEEREMGCYYICPSCGEEVEGTDIREVC